MKRLLIVLLLFLFLLSSCGYTAEDINAIEDKWLSEYSDLEQKYLESYSRAEDLKMLLSNINENYITASCYYDDADPDVTEEEAHAALLKIGDLLHEVGY